MVRAVMSRYRSSIGTGRCAWDFWRYLSLLLGIGIVLSCEACLSCSRRDAELFHACRVGDMAVITNCLARGANINYTRHHSMHTPLHMAIAGGHLDAATHLIESGAEFSIRSRHGATEGETAFLWCVSAGYTNLVKRMLENGADANQRSVSGNALTYAIASQKYHMASILREYGAREDAVPPVRLYLGHGLPVEQMEILINGHLFFRGVPTVGFVHKEVFTNEVPAYVRMRIHLPERNDTIMTVARVNRDASIRFVVFEGNYTFVDEKGRPNNGLSRPVRMVPVAIIE